MKNLQYWHSLRILEQLQITMPSYEISDTNCTPSETIAFIMTKLELAKNHYLEMKKNPHYLDFLPAMFIS